MNDIDWTEQDKTPKIPINSEVTWYHTKER